MIVRIPFKNRPSNILPGNSLNAKHWPNISLTPWLGHGRVPPPDILVFRNPIQTWTETISIPGTRQEKLKFTLKPYEINTRHTFFFVLIIYLQEWKVITLVSSLSLYLVMFVWNWFLVPTAYRSVRYKYASWYRKFKSSKCKFKFICLLVTTFLMCY